jgi:hypothetical protein
MDAPGTAPTHAEFKAILDNLASWRDSGYINLVTPSLLVSAVYTPLGLGAGEWGGLRDWSFEKLAINTSCTLDIVAAAGAITGTPTVSAGGGGTGYVAGDYLRIGGGNGDARVTVATVSGTAVATVSIVTAGRGTGYTTGNDNATAMMLRNHSTEGGWSGNKSEIVTGQYLSLDATIANTNANHALPVRPGGNYLLRFNAKYLADTATFFVIFSYNWYVRDGASNVAKSFQWQCPTKTLTDTFANYYLLFGVPSWCRDVTIYLGQASGTCLFDKIEMAPVSA